MAPTTGLSRPRASRFCPEKDAWTQATPPKRRKGGRRPGNQNLQGVGNYNPLHSSGSSSDSSPPSSGPLPCYPMASDHEAVEGELHTKYGTNKGSNALKCSKGAEGSRHRDHMGIRLLKGFARLRCRHGSDHVDSASTPNKKLGFKGMVKTSDPKPYK